MAAPYVDLAGGCQNILRYMGDITKNNYPFLLTKKIGMIEALLDPANGSIKLDLVNAQMGKKVVKSKVVYKVRAKACEILEDGDVPSICEAGTEPAENSVEVSIDKIFSTPVLTFSNAKMINICQDTDAFIKEYVATYRNALLQKINEYLLGQADAAIGVTRHQNGDADTPAGSYKTKQILGVDSNTGTMVPLYANYADILLDYQYNQLNGVPFLIGEGNLQKFMMLSKFSCCNAAGVAYDSAIANAGAAFYLDQAANSILGANNFLSIAPNVLHLLWFNQNHNINMDSPTRRRIVVPDPIYPQLKYDFFFEYTCEDTWNFKMSTWVGLFNAFQADSFGAEDSTSPVCEDDLIGLTGVSGYTATSV